MKKFLSAIMACLVTMTFVTTVYALEDPYGTFVNISNSEPTIFSSNVLIKDQYDNTLWGLGQTGNIRSDPYIMNSEKLYVSVVIEDLDGEPEAGSYYLNAIVINDYTEDEEYYIPLLFSHYINNPDNTRALYEGEITIDHGECQHTIYLFDSDFFNYEHLFNPLYINPYMTGSLAPSSIIWTDLSLGSENIESEGNPFSYNVEAMCLDEYGTQVPVAVNYELNISGTDMTHTTNPQYLIPSSNIEYSISSGTYTPLPLYPNYNYIGQYVANGANDFGFRISIPTNVQKGDYEGDIYLNLKVV